MAVYQVALGLLGMLSWDSPHPISAFASSLSCNETTNCTENASCIKSDGFCECEDGYQFTLEHGDQVCRRCPGLHDPCDTDCCYPPDLTACVKKVCQCNGNFYDNSCSEMEQYKLATQVALGCAIILAIACLVIILWKSCKRRRELARLGAARREDRSGSVSSAQRAVMDLLRHRPPGYYDRDHIRIEKPPTYEESVEQPLRFPIINIDHQQAAVCSAGQTRTRNPASPDQTTLGTPQLSGQDGRDNLAFVLTDEKEGTPEGSSPHEASIVPASDLHM